MYYNRRNTKVIIQRRPNTPPSMRSPGAWLPRFNNGFYVTSDEGVKHKLMLKRFRGIVRYNLPGGKELTWTWILVALGITGVILNNHKRKECFYVWGFTSGCWCAIDWYHGIYSQAVLFAIYFGLAIHGWWKWK